MDVTTLDWETLGLRLLDWTYRVLRLHYGYSNPMALPCGETPEKLVEDLARAYLAGVRSLNPSWPVDGQLRRAMRSRLWALHQRKEFRVTTHAESEEAFALDESNPAVELQSRDQCEAIFRLLLSHPRVRKSPELSRLIQGFMTGLEDEADLAVFTGLAISKIYELRRVLRKIYPSIQAKLQEAHP